MLYSFSKSQCSLRLIVMVVLLVCSFNLFFHLDHIKEAVFQPPPYLARPHVYEDEVDFRVIVVSHNRHESLQKVLNSLETLHLDGDSAALEIWIDPNDHGVVHNETAETARRFRWSLGPTRVHIHAKHVGILGQWIDTWRPLTAPPHLLQVPQNDKIKIKQARIKNKVAKPVKAKKKISHGFEEGLKEEIVPTYGKEIALILEDDMTVSPHAYRWLKAVHEKYGRRKDFGGVTLYSNSVFAHNNHRTLIAPKNESAYMYVCVGTWGFSPSSYYWPVFQDWYHARRKTQKVTKFQPLVPGTVPSGWFSSFLAQGSQDSMWEMWFIYFSEMMDIYTVYSNLEHSRGKAASALGVNREEVGLHYPTKGSDKYELLLREWKEEYMALLPQQPIKFDWNGDQLPQEEHQH